MRVEVEKQIDVAVRALGTPRRRTKAREVFDAKLLETRRGRAENLENVEKFLRVGGRRRCGWPSEDGAARKQGDTRSFECRSDGRTNRSEDRPLQCQESQRLPPAAGKQKAATDTDANGAG